MMCFGHFGHIVGGAITLITWKSEAILEAGANLHTGETFLFEDLAPGAPFNKFADEHFQFATLGEGQSWWLPYGHCYAIITHLGSRSKVIIQPVVSHVLVKKMPQAIQKHVRWFWEESFVKMAEARIEPWPTLHEEIINWIEASLDIPVADNARVIPAISDASEAQPIPVPDIDPAQSAGQSEPGQSGGNPQNEDNDSSSDDSGAGDEEEQLD